MCLPDFVEFRRIKKSDPIVGYRNWRIPINGDLILQSESQDYIWELNVGRHKVLESNSGIYAYNNYYYNNYNYYNNHGNYNYNYSDYGNYNYTISGIIHQYGRVAIHQIGQRSEYTKVITLFTIRESDALGPKEFLDWIKKFNELVVAIAKKYGANTIHYQGFVESGSKNKE